MLFVKNLCPQAARVGFGNPPAPSRCQGWPPTVPRSHAALSTAHQSHAVAVAHATALLLAGHVVAVAAPPGSEALGMLEAATAGAMDMARERLERMEFL